MMDQEFKNTGQEIHLHGRKVMREPHNTSRRILKLKNTVHVVPINNISNATPDLIVEIRGGHVWDGDLHVKEDLFTPRGEERVGGMVAGTNARRKVRTSGVQGFEGIGEWYIVRDIHLDLVGVVSRRHDGKGLVGVLLLRVDVWMILKRRCGKSKVVFAEMGTKGVFIPVCCSAESLRQCLYRVEGSSPSLASKTGFS